MVNEIRNGEGAVTDLPVPLKYRFEFLSKEWFAEAREFCAKLSVELRAALDGVEWSLSERYEAVPAHLEAADGVAGVCVRISDGEITIGDAPDPDADVHVRAIYDVGVVAATSVRAGDDEAHRRSRRELVHSFGAKALDVSGSASLPPAVAVGLAALHDQLARRTLTNPDLGHRLHHLGLDRHVAELDENGYTILEHAISQEFVDELRELIIERVAEARSGSPTAARLLERGRLFEEAALHPRILALAEHLVGRGALMAQSAGMRRTAGFDSHPGLHVDYPLVPDPFPVQCLLTTTIWALDDFEADAGPTVVVPGSYRSGHNVPAGTGQEAAVELVMPRGSIAMWHGGTWHGAAVRKAPGERVTLHNSFSRVYMRTYDDYTRIEPSILERNPPAFTTLCGLDDLFGKNRNDGPDLARAAYAGRSGYGS